MHDASDTHLTPERACACACHGRVHGGGRVGCHACSAEWPAGRLHCESKWLHVIAATESLWISATVTSGRDPASLCFCVDLHKSLMSES